MSINNPKLEKITINSIKGIRNKIFNLDLYPNKPSILVAPNGFGKSSFAIAFSSFNNKRLILDDDNKCQAQDIESPSIKILHNGIDYVIDETQNTYSKNFDTCVINCSLYAKSKNQYMGGFTVAKASLEIADIELVSSIPAKVELNYSIKSNKETFGLNGKILPNINYLLDNKFLFKDLQQIDNTKFDKFRTYINPLNKIKDKINNYNGTTNDILNDNKQELILDFASIDCLRELKEIIKKYSDKQEDILLYLESIQFVDILKNENFKKYMKRCLYEIQKEELNNLIINFNTTGIDLKLQEETKNHKKRLVFKFPSANRISNGQRDILTFITSLTKARLELNKQNNLLIIDEIFDYLDDANLISFQYYITKFIEEYKKNDKNLYCILLTHLDPEYINNFCFGQHKLQIRYLMNTGTTRQSIVKNLIKKRLNDTNKNEEISKYLLHFYNGEITIEEYNNKQFYDKMYKEVYDKYLKEENYDSLKICLAVRIKIEEIIYNKLNSQELKEEFIKTHGTKEKLNFAVDKGIDVPEIYFLLGIIYNDNMHWRENRDFDTPLRTKLSNLVIKNMIKTIFNERT